MRIRLLVTALILVAAAALFGCGEESKSTDTSAGGANGIASTAPDPCTLVTKAEIEAIMGEPVKEADQAQVPAGLSCTYTSVQQPPRLASLTIIEPCTMADYANIGVGEPVEGLGMHAAWDKSLLYVHLESNTCLIVSGGGVPRGAADDTLALENAKKVANEIIEELGPQQPM